VAKTTLCAFSEAICNPPPEERRPTRSRRPTSGPKPQLDPECSAETRASGQTAIPHLSGPESFTSRAGPRVFFHGRRPSIGPSVVSSGGERARVLSLNSCLQPPTLLLSTSPPRPRYSHAGNSRGKVCSNSRCTSSGLRMTAFSSTASPRSSRLDGLGGAGRFADYSPGESCRKKMRPCCRGKMRQSKRCYAGQPGRRPTIEKAVLTLQRRPRTFHDGTNHPNAGKNPAEKLAASTIPPSLATPRPSTPPVSNSNPPKNPSTPSRPAGRSSKLSSLARPPGLIALQKRLVSGHYRNAIDC